MNTPNLLQNDEELEIVNGEQRWRTSWHPPDRVPHGQPHGSAGICVLPTGEMILVSQDGQIWDFPAGRPQGDETWEETLRREIIEESCSLVTDTHLLGYCRSQCCQGVEQGLVLVRAIWRAKVELLDWEPRFEINHRKVVPGDEAIAQTPKAYQPIWRRAFAEMAAFKD